jgi:hypothetical protein
MFLLLSCLLKLYFLSTLVCLFIFFTLRYMITASGDFVIIAKCRKTEFFKATIPFVAYSFFHKDPINCYRLRYLQAEQQAFAHTNYEVKEMFVYESNSTSVSDTRTHRTSNTDWLPGCSRSSNENGRKAMKRFLIVEVNVVPLHATDGAWRESRCSF